MREDDLQALFDASALTNLLVLAGGKTLDVVRGGSILDLTPYEVGNAVWRMYKLSKRMSREQMIALLNVGVRVMARMDTIRCSSDDFQRTVEVAVAKGLTFYDAAYLYVAGKWHLPLVTDDLKLAKAAGAVGTLASSVVLSGI